MKPRIVLPDRRRTHRLYKLVNGAMFLFFLVGGLGVWLTEDEPSELWEAIEDLFT